MEAGKFYRAIVEDNNHPDKNGKVRVRIYGIHTKNNEYSGDDFNFIKTEDLPWAEVIQPLDFGFNSGLGVSRVPLQGSLVMVILENDDVNKPYVICS